MTRRQPVAVTDIGSNSVRLVVYSGRLRAPTPIFNEKVMAGLGAGLREDGDLSDDSERKALSALCRYKLLLRHMGVKQVQVVATAAVRDAANGRGLRPLRRENRPPLRGDQRGRRSALFGARGRSPHFRARADWSATSAAAASS